MSMNDGAGADGAPVLWVYVSDGYYQPAVPRREVALMRPSPGATPPGGTGSVVEYLLLLPTGGGVFPVEWGMHANNLLCEIGSWTTSMQCNDSSKCRRGWTWLCIGAMNIVVRKPVP